MNVMSSACVGPGFLSRSFREFSPFMTSGGWPRFRSVAARRCLADRFDGLEGDAQTHRLVAAGQVHDLIERGAEGFHIYTMNRAGLAVAFCRMIGVKSKPVLHTAETPAAA